MVDRDDLLELITIEDVKSILKYFGSDEPKIDNQGNLYFQTICHGGGSHKLHFFTDSKLFMCYTCCGSMSIYDLLMNINNWKFSQAFDFLLDYKGIKRNVRKVGLQESTIDYSEFDFLKIHLYEPKKNKISLPKYNPKVLNMFDDYCPNTWIKEGIKKEVMQYFGIRFYFNQYKAIIPHYDINGNLVGIKSRNFFQHEVENNKKYIPITIQGLTYRYPKNFNLYGIYQNKENIRRLKKAVIFESEKSVYKYASIYGQENNIALATGGMTISLYQRDLILNQGVEEVVIALDKQYQIEYLKDEYKNTKEYKEYIKYMKNLYKIIKMFINYCNISIILCWDDRLDYKEAPIDRGQEIYEELFKNRYLINDIDSIEEMIY